MRQLARIVLTTSSGSPDEQATAPDEGGSYGELMDQIDRVLEQVTAEDRDRSDP